MITLLFILVTVAVLGGLGVFYFFRIHRPIKEMQDALHRLANRDFSQLVFSESLTNFSQTATNIQKISDLLREQVRQIADEGFNLRAILSSMVEGVMIVDNDQKIRLVNQSIRHLFHLTQSPINRSVIEVFRRHEIQQTILLAMEKGSAQRMGLNLELWEDDHMVPRTFELCTMALRPNDQQNPIGAVVVFHDITEVKKLEAIRKEFVANVSHEFRTPLSIINGYVETLLDGALKDHEMTTHSLRVMHKHGQRLNLLIEDLLTISKLEYRAEPLHFQRINLREVLDRTLEQLESTIHHRKATMNIQFPAETAVAEVDAWRMEQVYFNLITNALQHGASEDLQIIISAKCQDNQITICVQDNGPGIPMEDQPHIFERFYRVHKDRSRDAGGTGLGLSIVKNIVQAHGGSVSVESMPGEGARFCFTIPVSQQVTK